jgi:hypothetical protein
MGSAQHWLYVLHTGKYPPVPIALESRKATGPVRKQRKIILLPGIERRLLRPLDAAVHVQPRNSSKIIHTEKQKYSLFARDIVHPLKISQ